MPANDKHKEEAKKVKEKEQQNSNDRKDGQEKTKDNIQDTFE
ncbi:hypothetical protein [Mammaliicoccus sp. Dog046]|nr:hypothetical protein [Mammaliicoccus sp. Dog046]WQK84728.1 hypothetical protein P3U32_08805 [Mammaliicoccus sp. Dog046]